MGFPVVGSVATVAVEMMPCAFVPQPPPVAGVRSPRKSDHRICWVASLTA